MTKCKASKQKRETIEAWKQSPPKIKAGRKGR